MQFGGEESYKKCETSAYASKQNTWKNEGVVKKKIAGVKLWKTWFFSTYGVVTVALPAL